MLPYEGNCSTPENNREAASRMLQANSGNFVLALGEERPRIAT